MDAAVLGDRLPEVTQKPLLGSSTLSMQCQHWESSKVLAGLVFCEMLSQYPQSAFQGSPRVAGGGGGSAAVCDLNPPRPFARSRKLQNEENPFRQIHENPLFTQFKGGGNCFPKRGPEAVPTQHNYSVCQVRKDAEWKFPEFFIFCPEFCSEFCPNFSRTFRASFRGRRRPEKNSPKIPASFQCKIPRQTQKIHSQNSSGEQAKKLFASATPQQGVGIIERGVLQAYLRARASSATLCSVHV